jgi:hypothetical protein
MIGNNKASSHTQINGNTESNYKPLATIAPRPSQGQLFYQNPLPQVHTIAPPPPPPIAVLPQQAPPQASPRVNPEHPPSDTLTPLEAKPKPQVVDPKRKYKIWTIPDGGSDGITSSDRLFELLLNDNGKKLTAVAGAKYQGHPVKEKKSTVLIQCVQYFQDKGVDFRTKLQQVIKYYWKANSLDKKHREEAKGDLVPTNERDLEGI